MSIGLKRGTVQLIPYNPAWADEYNKEEANLRDIFGEALIDIQHVGSTAIPGMNAKPLIDIAVAVESLDVVDRFIPDLVKAGYEHMPERITAERAFFPKGPRENRTHHLSIIAAGSDEWTRHIGFRDYLRSHPEAVRDYNELKATLAEKYANDRYAYTAAKKSFIDSIHDKVKSTHS